MTRRLPSGVLALAVALGGLAATGTVSGSATETAIETTSRAITAQSLAEQTLVIAAGGLLLGAGLGVALASGATYWYKSREIGGRLQ
ncbi:hypothetical protein [Natrinema salaciae]|uniref:Uncharacterized protein n=1 Tax=Natrinema salaciae TaxID=1186196 RepID=A0A1H9NNT0_9EURY|nr:hypothetical protein [Natrinema salaciae]SER37606.1 hypothetical protein SAMN04489841_3676 [Natrinema salaciae]